MRVAVADVGDHRRRERTLFQILPGRGAPNSAASTDSGMLRNLPRLAGRASGEELPDGRRHALHQSVVFFSTADLVPLPMPGAQIRIAETFFLGTVKSIFLHQDALTLVSPPGPAEAHDYGEKATMVPRAPRQRGVAPGQEDQVVEIGAS